MFQVFNQKLAGYLMLHGFRLVSMEPNPSMNEYNIFNFQNSIRLAKAITDYQIYKLQKENNQNEQR